MRSLRAILFTLVFLITALGAFFFWYRFDSARNRGYQFGYYGDYNRVSNALASIPGVTVTNTWMNNDITLEEFAFGILTGEGKSLEILIAERDPIRQLSGPPLVEALKTRITAQSSMP